MAALTGAVAAAIVGWVAGTRIVATDLLGAVGLGAAIGVGSAVVMAAVAVMVDPSLVRRLRQLRATGPDGGRNREPAMRVMMVLGDSTGGSEPTSTDWCAT